MKHPAEPEKSGFDRYASDYDTALSKGISVSGETKDYFAQGRVDWMEDRLQDLHCRPGSILDFGCGTGTNVPFLLKVEGIASVVGVDVSESSLDAARSAVADPRASFSAIDRFRPVASHDLAFTNGVFHHIPPPERPAALDYIFRSLRPGGLLVFWENNPWNPGTRYVMSRIPFDRDAITLNARQAQRLIQAAGFDVLRTDFLFIFPRTLRWFRKFESRLVGLPFGAQYQVLCRKPMS